MPCCIGRPSGGSALDRHRQLVVDVGAEGSARAAVAKNAVDRRLLQEPLHQPMRVLTHRTEYIAREWNELGAVLRSSRTIFGDLDSLVVFDLAQHGVTGTKWKSCAWRCGVADADVDDVRPVRSNENKIGTRLPLFVQHCRGCWLCEFDARCNAID